MRGNLSERKREGKTFQEMYLFSFGIVFSFTSTLMLYTLTKYNEINKPGIKEKSKHVNTQINPTVFQKTQRAEMTYLVRKLKEWARLFYSCKWQPSHFHEESVPLQVPALHARKGLRSQRVRSRMRMHVPCSCEAHTEDWVNKTGKSWLQTADVGCEESDVND